MAIARWWMPYLRRRVGRFNRYSTFGRCSPRRLTETPAGAGSPHIGTLPPSCVLWYNLAISRIRIICRFQPEQPHASEVRQHISDEEAAAASDGKLLIA